MSGLLTLTELTPAPTNVLATLSRVWNDSQNKGYQSARLFHSSIVFHAGIREGTLNVRDIVSLFWCGKVSGSVAGCFYHANSIDPLSITFTSLGHDAVVIFFVLSGFVIA